MTRWLVITCASLVALVAAGSAGCSSNDGELARDGEGGRDTTPTRGDAAAPPVPMMGSPRAALDSCRAGRFLGSACPRRLPQVSGYNTRWIVRSRSRETFEFQRGAASPFYPERDRPPRVAHVVVEAATAQGEKRLLPFPVDEAETTPRSGMSAGNDAKAA